MTYNIHTFFRRIEQATGCDELTPYYTKDRIVEKPEIEQIQILRDAKPTQKKQTKKDRERAKRLEKTNLRLLNRLKTRVKKLIGHNVEPRLIPADLWLNCYTIVWDASGRAVREFARLCKNKIALARLHRAALENEFGETRQKSYFGWSRYAVRARRIFATGWLLLQSSVRTNRNGPYNRLCWGIPQTAIIDALAGGDKRQRIWPTTLSGRHRTSGRAGDWGYIDALKRAGFLETRQAKWIDGDKPSGRQWKNFRPCEIGGKRGALHVSLNRYWIISDCYNDTADDDIRMALWTDYIAGSQPFDQWCPNNTAYNIDAYDKTSDKYVEKPPD